MKKIIIMKGEEVDVEITVKLLNAALTSEVAHRLRLVDVTLALKAS